MLVTGLGMTRRRNHRPVKLDARELGAFDGLKRGTLLERTLNLIMLVDNHAKEERRQQQTGAEEPSTQGKKQQHTERQSHHKDQDT